MCVFAVYKNFGLEIVENCIDEIENILITESDISTKRNAFMTLFNIEQERALKYLGNVLQAEDPVAEMGDIFQLSVLEMLRKLCKQDPSQKSKYMNAIFMMSNSKSSSVLFECASTIVQLTTAPSAIKVAIQRFLNLLQE
jgi:coatomer subunit beta